MIVFIIKKCKQTFLCNLIRPPRAAISYQYPLKTFLIVHPFRVGQP